MGVYVVVAAQPQPKWECFALRLSAWGSVARKRHATGVGLGTPRLPGDLQPCNFSSKSSNILARLAVILQRISGWPGLSGVPTIQLQCTSCHSLRLVLEELLY